MSTIVECSYCQKPYLPGEAVYCPQCGGRLPESQINVRAFVENPPSAKNKEALLEVNRHISPQYKALEFSAHLQVVFGWFIIFVAIFIAMSAFPYFVETLPKKVDAIISYESGAPQLTKPAIEEKNPTAVGLSILVGLFGTIQGLRVIANGQLMLLQIDLAEETTIMNREMQRFFLWYAKRVRAKNK